MNSTIRAWICAMRPRTLPLSLSVIFLGAGLAASHGFFSWTILLFTVILAILLQALSDFANDYGDAKNNLDGEDRVGPTRTVSSGAITPKQMLKGIYLVITLIFINGIILFSLSFGSNVWKWLIFGLLLCFAVWAAISYTMGKKPYGYRARGDYYVFIFFGLVSVLGSYYLYTDTLTSALLLPATAAGLLSTAVLNINNTRDMEGDKKNGKYTIAIRLGAKGARVYQVCLVSFAIVCWLIYLATTFAPWAVLLILLALPIIKSTHRVFNTYDTSILNHQLKVTALSIAFFHISMAIILAQL